MGQDVGAPSTAGIAQDIDDVQLLPSNCGKALGHTSQEIQLDGASLVIEGGVQGLHDVC